MASCIAPWLSLEWNGYTAEEVERRSEKRRLDAVVVPIFAAWYLLLATCAAAPEGAAAAASAAPPSMSTVVMQAVLAAAAVYVLAVHCIAFPSPTANQDAWKVQSILGRWTYLTRHCVTLQAWHQVLSFASVWIPGLVAPTHGFSICVATLGWFVTIQYFVLVVPSQPFKDDIELWRKRGVHFKELGEILHVPALPIAVLDLLFGKTAAVLHAAVSMPATGTLLAAYVLIYLSLIAANYRVVGVWPYGFMKSFSPMKWVTFIVGQVAVLMVFLAANAVLLCLRTMG